MTRFLVNGLDVTDYPFMVPFNETDFGTPEVTSEALTSFLTQGSLQTKSTGNRTLTLPIIIEETDPIGLARAEAALWTACDVDYGEVQVEPEPFGPPFVFQTFNGQMTLARNDDEERSGLRSYTLTWQALPWVLSAERTVVEALGSAAVATTVVVDDCSSTTGWSATFAGIPVTPTEVTVAGDTTVQASGDLPAAVSQPVRFAMTRAGAVGSLDSTPYVAIDWTLAYPADSAGMSLSSPEGQWTKVSEAFRPSGTFVRSIFKAPAGVTSVTALTSAVTTAYSAGTVTHNIGNVSRSNQIGSFATKQQLQNLAIGGSAPTVGSIAVQHPTAALGDGVLVYTFSVDKPGAAAYSPPCRVFRSSGPAQNPDVTAVTGVSVSLDTGENYDVPNSALPAGEYLVMARLQATTATPSVYWSVTAMLGGVAIGDPDVRQRTVDLGAPSQWRTVALGMITLPLLTTPPSGVHRVGLVAGNPTADDVYVDEVWLFNMSIGRLTQSDCGTGAASVAASSRLWIDSPAIANDGLGLYLRGTAADRSDGYSAYPALKAAGVHEFKPPLVKVLTVTPGVTSPAVSFDYRKGWHSHAAE